MAIFGMATAGWRPRAPAPQRVRSPCPSYYHPRAHTVTEGGRSMKKSLTRIRTSHVGRLPPPKGWEDMPARLANAELTDPAAIAAEVTPAIAETVKKQVETGIDCIGDGEFWTARSLAHYTAHFTGIEARPVAPGEPPTTPTRPASATNSRTSMPIWTGPEPCCWSPVRSRCRRSRCGSSLAAR